MKMKINQRKLNALKKRWGGEEYISTKCAAMEKKKVLPGCNLLTCKRICGLKFNEENRQILYDKYYSMNIQDRKVLLLSLISEDVLKRRRKDSRNIVEQKLSVKYYLPTKKTNY